MGRRDQVVVGRWGALALSVVAFAHAAPPKGAVASPSAPAVAKGPAAAADELDPAKRAEIYGELLGIMIDDAPFVVLYQPVDRKPASKAVQGVATHPVYMLQLRNASKSA